MCDNGLAETTAFQRMQAARLEMLVRDAMREIRKAYPDDPAWRTFESGWTGNIVPGPTPNVATYDADTGCLVVGIPPHAALDAVLNARALLAVSRGVSRKATCTTLHSKLLRFATERLGIDASLDCSDAEGHGLISPKACPACTWTEGAPLGCHVKRFVWPEYLGRYVTDVVKQFRGVRVETVTWDSLNRKPAAKDVVRITFDARTGIVVVPPPHLGNVNMPEGKDWNCFISPDAGSKMRCIGAPVPPSPETWGAYVGKYVTDVVDSLRIAYPHATIEYLPTTASVSDELRPDRVRVRFDSDSGFVVAVPRIG